MVRALPSEYIVANISPRRWEMAPIRGGCLPLAVETGRYHSPKIPLSDRLCDYCSSDAVEDITHILFCTKYTICTALFLKNFLSLNPTVQAKLIIILILLVGLNVRKFLLFY